MKLDIFNHIFPKKFYDRMLKVAPNGKDIHKRVREIPAIVDLDARFRIMDQFGDYAQVICLGSPPIEVFGPPPVSTDMARLANDGMAELVRKHPDRFPAFIASLPMNDPGGLLKEAKRAVRELGAVGVQVFTNVLGKPLTAPETLPLFELMAKLDLPIWLHPARGADFPDYQKEKKSHYEIWWTFGWPYETSAAMAHIVFEGLFDRFPDLKIITHHMGGMIPYFEGRVGPGWDQLGKRTSDVDYTQAVEEAQESARSTTSGCSTPTRRSSAPGRRRNAGCASSARSRVLFASDSPFDPEKGSMYTRTTIEIVDRLDISPEERHAIYEGNARRLLRLPARRAAA